MKNTDMRNGCDDEVVNAIRKKLVHYFTFYTDDKAASIVFIELKELVDEPNHHFFVHFLHLEKLQRKATTYLTRVTKSYVHRYS